ncbi:L-threonine dehydratase catabolic TdcB-like [Bacillus rossius redtenbacheri]|uniref:L-threonine dehydratase catabolic TdcB-like n=1 Tax=Bacillus rossius redtenbacheri TaxID=93214 RepID=UPI002FDEF53D
MEQNKNNSGAKRECCEPDPFCFLPVPVAGPMEEVPSLPDACDPEYQKLQLKDIKDAYERIRPEIAKTPCYLSKLCSELCMQLYIKDETKHYTGSFKERGARNALLKLAPQHKKNGVVTVSAGNHGLGLSYHGRHLCVPVTVVMPQDAACIKAERCKALCAEVQLRSGDMGAMMRSVAEEAKQSGRAFISAYDHIDVMAGQGTIGMEILEDVPDVDAILVPIGGGGLIAGIATVVKKLRPCCEIIGVESVKCPSFHNALVACKPTFVPCSKTLTDGMVVPCVGHNAFYNARRKISRLVLVDEEMVERAMLCLVEREKVVAEGSGAAALAVLVAGQLPDLMKKRVVVILSGGNIDSLVLSCALRRALMHEGLLVRFEVRLDNKTCATARLLQVIAETGANVRDIRLERCGHQDVDVFSVLVSVVCETCTWKQSEDLMDRLEQTYPEVRFERDPNTREC